MEKLIGVLNRLVTAGNSVLVIEHNLDVIKTCDWLLDMGPEGGDGGSRLIAQGHRNRSQKYELHRAYLQKHLGCDAITGGSHLSRKKGTRHYA